MKSHVEASIWMNNSLKNFYKRVRGFWLPFSYTLDCSKTLSYNLDSVLGLLLLTIVTTGPTRDDHFRDILIREIVVEDFVVEQHCWLTTLHYQINGKIIDFNRRFSHQSCLHKSMPCMVMNHIVPYFSAVKIVETYSDSIAELPDCYCHEAELPGWHSSKTGYRILII